MSDNRIQMVFPVNNYLRNEFKSACAFNGESMSAVLRAFVLDYVDRYRSEVSDELKSCRSRKTPRSGALGEACQNNTLPVEREADSRGKERAEIPAEAVALRGRQ